MAIEKINIQQLISFAQVHIVLDVRSPAEYAHAHLPNAINLPLFTDEERKVVGTAYKQQSRQIAIKLGLDYFGVKMKLMVEAVEQLLTNTSKNKKEQQKTPTVIVHCWRGGMRSAAVAWLLDVYGFKVYQLSGGYKAYRAWVRLQFEQPMHYTIIGGYTGSGKTEVLQKLIQLGKPVIQLETLANHKGSAFGAIGQAPQPTQEMFENLLGQNIFSASQFALANNQQTIFIEDESQRIGLIKLPNTFWQTMRNSPILFLDIPFIQRLQYIVLHYGSLPKEKLINAIMRIQKRLGGLETKNAINFLLENNPTACFNILLLYYDKWYIKGLNNRDNLPTLLNKISCTNVDIENAHLLLHEKNNH